MHRLLTNCFVILWLLECSLGVLSRSVNRSQIMLDQDYESIDQVWSDLDQAPLPNFDSDSGSELIDDEADTIFECKQSQFKYSECLLFDDLHWLNDLDELDKTLDNYQNRTRVKINPVDTEFTIYQQPAPVQGGYKYKRKKPPVTTKRTAARQSH